MLKNKNLSIDTITMALTKVENANKIELSSLKGYVEQQPAQAIMNFQALSEAESIDDKLKKIMNEMPHLRGDAHHVLEAAILLQ
ncbi:hypothetical protein KI655_14335 [Vibrio sp. D404a]|uniref:hypothetical protein n=1 Tax=unclassified Vibrio TaxID=2614977 RepID=UPI002563B1B8|nr:MULTISPECIES: hypothetical protein [unclassified Vibrio]MDK9738473.1 hypothetical protein [Vibrio sp. D404a]MDK9796163.1 hypothetical protein [Vibrio sp. D449a]